MPADVSVTVGSNGVVSVSAYQQQLSKVPGNSAPTGSHPSINDISRNTSQSSSIPSGARSPSKGNDMGGAYIPSKSSGLSKLVKGSGYLALGSIAYEIVDGLTDKAVDSYNEKLSDPKTNPIAPPDSSASMVSLNAHLKRIGDNGYAINSWVKSISEQLLVLSQTIGAASTGHALTVESGFDKVSATLGSLTQNVSDIPAELKSARFDAVGRANVIDIINDSYESERQRVAYKNLEYQYSLATSSEAQKIALETLAKKEFASTVNATAPTVNVAAPDFKPLSDAVAALKPPATHYEKVAAKNDAVLEHHTYQKTPTSVSVREGESVEASPRDLARNAHATSATMHHELNSTDESDFHNDPVESPETIRSLGNSEVKKAYDLSLNMLDETPLLDSAFTHSDKLLGVI